MKRPLDATSPAGRRHWDQLIADRIRLRSGRRSVRAGFAVVLVVGSVLALLPGVAAAHFDVPGINDAQLDMRDEAVNPFAPQPMSVTGRNFASNDRVVLFQCVAGATDLLNKCQTIGVAATDVDGGFSTTAPVSSVWVDRAGTAVTCAGWLGATQCSVAAATYNSSLEPTSMADHNVCFQGASPCTFVRPGGPTTTTTTTPTPAGPEWQPSAPMNVAREYLASAVGADGRIYAMGGHDEDGTVFASAELFDPCGTKTWTPIPPMPRARTKFAAATGPDGRIYVIGGRDAVFGTPLASVEVYDPTAGSWSEAAPLALPRSELAATTGPDGRIYAIGGVNGGGVTGFVEAFNVTTGQWEMVAPLTWPRSNHGATTGTDGRIYVTGGLTPSGNGLPVVTMETYTAGAAGTPGTWQPSRPFPIQPSDLGLLTGPDGLIYAIGGLDPLSSRNTLRSVSAYDPLTATWTAFTEPMVDRRSQHAAVTARDGRIYAIGGTDDAHFSDNPVVTDFAVPLASTESALVGPNNCPALPPVADFNGDRSADIAVFRPANGVSFFRGQIPEAIAWGAEGDIPVPRDYNGDKQSDLGVFRPSDGVWYLRGQTPDAVGWGTEGDIPVPADYDGDHKTDVAVFRPSSGTWYIRQSATNTDVAFNYGASGDVPVPADYDGDRKADIAVFRPANGVWYLRGQSPDATVYGAQGDIPVPADYDGDGDGDIAVFRPSNGVWFLRNQVPDAIAYGAEGDIPVPADYDGDGIADLTVFRPSNGVWYLENGQAIAWGAAGDVPLSLPPAIRMVYFGA